MTPPRLVKDRNGLATPASLLEVVSWLCILRTTDTDPYIRRIHADLAGPQDTLSRIGTAFIARSALRRFGGEL